MTTSFSVATDLIEIDPAHPSPEAVDCAAKEIHRGRVVGLPTDEWYVLVALCFFFSGRRRHTRYWRDWSSDVCSSDLGSADARSARLVVTYPGALRLTGTAPSATSMDSELHTVTWELVRIPPNDRRAVRLDFRVCADALADQDIVIRALLQSPVGEQTVSVVSLVTKIEAVAGVRVVGAEAPRTVFPREPVYVPFTVRNTGNGPDRFALRTQSDLGAGVTLVEDRNHDGVRQPDEPVVDTTRLLNPQEELTLLAELAVPSDAMDA